jgi:hypothetical protein
MRIKSKKEKKNKLLIEGEIKKKNQFNKRSKKNISKNENQIGNNNI